MRKIDCHMHVNGAGVEWGWDHNDRIIEAADALGIDQLVVSIPIMRGMPSFPTVRACNDAVIDCMRRYAGRILGYCYVVPGHRESIAEIDRCLDVGMVGIKLYNQYKIWDPAVHPVLEKAIAEAVPVLEHAGHPTTREFWDQQPKMSDAADFVHAAELYPECMLIEAHIGGGGDWEWSIRQLRNAPSVYLDTSGSIIDEGMVEMCVAELGADRILFATDMTMEGGVGKVLGADLNVAVKEKLFWRNFQKILDRRRSARGGTAA
ncbi:MAG: amidohydrolase family protein [Candidatus Latescibacterota bacterium]|nr:amidohydrolase family protein [Candidatus Latescibacterota bacterium]